MARPLPAWLWTDEKREHIHANTRACTLIATLFMIAKNGNKSNACQLWTHKQNVASPYRRMLFGNEKEWSADNATTWTNLKHIKLSERSQSRKNTYHVTSCQWNVQNRQTQGDRKELVTSSGCGTGEVGVTALCMGCLFVMWMLWN